MDRNEVWENAKEVGVCVMVCGVASCGSIGVEWFGNARTQLRYRKSSTATPHTHALADVNTIDVAGK